MTTSLPANLATQRRHLLDNEPALLRVKAHQWGRRDDRNWHNQLDRLEQQMMNEWSSRYRVVPAGGEVLLATSARQARSVSPYWYSAEEDAGTTPATACLSSGRPQRVIAIAFA